LPKLPRLTATEAEKFLLDANFIIVKIKGSHTIYLKNNIRVVVPFHSGIILHPKIVKQVFKAISQSQQSEKFNTVNSDRTLIKNIFNYIF